MPTEYNFTFGSFHSRVIIREKLPDSGEIALLPSCLAICDEHTEPILRRILGAAANSTVFTLVLPSGEQNKGWNSVEAILKAARRLGLGRDGLFLAAGGGVLCDLAGFAASVYMRGARLALVPTTLLAMADAALGGKTGFDFEGIKNLAGTFYPAEEIFVSLEALETLPEREWKSGMAEIIKAAILERPADGQAPGFSREPGESLRALAEAGGKVPAAGPWLSDMLAMAVTVKGAVVQADPRETGSERALLNLGHTFGHALEAAAGLGVVSHGEAVAWGIARACRMGRALGITPRKRAAAIMDVLSAWGYHTAVPYPAPVDPGIFKNAILSDKKKKNGGIRFVVPNADRAELVEHNGDTETYLEKLFTDLER
ncbi:MAG: 3-dehydroquinate synthase [Treponema sp.]|jgi:3-dehydroquinate synthase|nr:3-dehydroquinate synthase [Treponema sp.]